MEKQMPDFTKIPYSYRQCREMRISLIRDVRNGDDKETYALLDNAMTKYRRKGSAYGVLCYGIPIFLTYYKFPNIKPHYSGIIVALTLGYVCGAFASLDYHHKDMFNVIGKLPDSSQEARRLEVLENCKHV